MFLWRIGLLTLYVNGTFNGSSEVVPPPTYYTEVLK